MRLPTGFQAAGVRAGLKASGRPDLGLLSSPHPLYWALTSTENQLKAPCVSRNRARHITSQTVRCVVVNSGNANCANGERGVWDNEDFAAATASALGLGRAQDALTASTGVIGHPFPLDKIRPQLGPLVSALSSDSSAFAEAILTTDTGVKETRATLRGGASIVGVAKGSGMIHPNMATMLAFVTTDAALSQETLRALWPQLVARSFNQLTVDGDTSPNDMALLLSSHQIQVDAQAFAHALEEVCRSLTAMIARDGEGATKLLVVEVRGGRSEDEARLAARAVARSPLVKAAAHGNDPNWGRVLSTVGASGAVFDLSKVRIALQGQDVYRGEPQPFDPEALSKSLDAETVTIAVDLAAGDATGTAWGCDLSAEYVRINAEYHT